MEQPRLAARLAATGAQNPELAAALLVARGRRLLDQEGFARLAGVPVSHLRSLESGRRPPSHAPRRLTELDGTVDWRGAGVLPRGHPHDPASRHPAANRRRVEPAPDLAVPATRSGAGSRPE